MAEEQKQNEAAQPQDTEAQAPTEAPEAARYREGYVKGLETQVKEFKEFKARIEQEKESARLKEMEEENRLKELLSEKEKKFLAEMQARDKEIESMRIGALKKDLEVELIGAGMSKERDAFTIKGIVTDYLSSDPKERMSVAEFVEALKKKSAHLFEQKKVAQPPATGGVPAANGSGSKSIFDADFTLRR